MVSRSAEYVWVRLRHEYGTAPATTHTHTHIHTGQLQTPHPNQLEIICREEMDVEQLVHTHPHALFMMTFPPLPFSIPTSRTRTQTP